VVNNDDKPSLFEQHAQTVVGATVLALLLGSGGLLVAMREDVQVLKRDVQHLGDTLKSAGDDRFRGADWRREERAITDRFERLELRVEKLEGMRR
jgi:hypothetical protein